MKRCTAVFAAGALCLLGWLCWGPAPLLARPEADRALAEKARVVLEKNCLRCHGVTRASGRLDVRDYKVLITPGKKNTYVVPKDLKNSLLWEKIDSGEMPQDAELAEADKQTLRLWIEAGAPAPAAATVAAARPFASVRETLAAIRDHLRAAEDEDKPYLRYFTFTHLHNNPAIPHDQLGRHRAALSKALNSMHWKKGVVVPQVVDKHGTVLAIDLRDLDWDRKGEEREDRWAVMLKRYPYGLGYEDSDEDELRQIDRDIDKDTRKTLVHVRADWFVAHATRPPLYEALLRLPGTAGELEAKLGVDVIDNFRRNRLARAGYARSFVSAQNRMVERHDALYGAYWKSYDFKKGRERGNLNELPLGPEFGAGGRAHPFPDLAFQHDGGEIIFNLPNGLQGYFLIDAKGKFIDKGPIDVVSDNQKTSGTAEIVNGLSCMACHKSGMIDSVLDEVRTGTAVSGAARQKVRRLYPPRPTMLKYVEEDREVFLGSLKKAVGPFLGEADKVRKPEDVTEPVGELVRNYYNPDLTAAVAAFELGYATPEEFKAALKGNEALRELGLRTFLGDGLIKREDWDRLKGQSLFQRAARGLGRGEPRRPR